MLPDYPDWYVRLAEDEVPTCQYCAEPIADVYNCVAGIVEAQVIFFHGPACFLGQVMNLALIAVPVQPDG